MYQHLSETAKEVLKLAEEIARRDRLDYVGTEHVLLGIMEHGLGLGAQVLQNAGITLELLQESIQQLTRSGSDDTWVLGRLPGSPHFKQVIANAIEEAELVRQKKVGTEYLLLGLLRETDCVAEKTLRRAGLTLSQARQEVARLQGRPQ
ncbi:MAG: hypothetical protein JW709_14155 [Sedimentisphaerales bacterium]|nr:hypothetical protein [Sedimentisphaerales bacterium]